MDNRILQREFSAGAVKHLFWFAEFRKVIQLLSEGQTIEELKARNKEQNFFGCPTMKRAGPNI